MVSFETYNSDEEMFEAMRRREEAANAGVLPIQQEVTWGSHWVTWNPGFEILIFGHCYTEDEARKAEMDAGADVAEADYTANQLRSSHERGYRFGWAYSVVVPDGEPGSTHIASMLGPITAEQFEEAKAEDWDFEVLKDREWLLELVRKGRAQAAEAAAAAGQEPPKDVLDIIVTEA